MITAEQYAEWKEHPVTKEIFNEIKIARKELVDKIILGNTLGQASDVTHGLTSRTIGQINGIDQLLNISYAVEESDEKVDPISGY